MLRNRLRGRSSQTLVGLGRHLKRCSSNGLVEKIQLQHSLRSFHISLTPEVSVCMYYIYIYAYMYM